MKINTIKEFNEYRTPSYPFGEINIGSIKFKYFVDCTLKTTREYFFISEKHDLGELLEIDYDKGFNTVDALQKYIVRSLDKYINFLSNQVKIFENIKD